MNERDVRALGVPALTPHWLDGRLLGGFMDRPHVEQVAAEWIASLREEAKAEFWSKWESARTAVGSLDEVSDFRALVGDPVEALEILHRDLLQREEISKAFAGTETSVRLVDLRRVVAQQPNVQTTKDLVPTEDHDLAGYCLPIPQKTPCELNVSFTPPIGQVMFLADVPYMNSVNFDTRNSQLTVSPPVHINFLQVIDFEGRMYLMNGYHRAYSLLNSGKQVVPAWVVSGKPPVLQGSQFFNLGYLKGLKRPPLLPDYLGPAAIDFRTRSKRYGMLMRVEIAPFNVPM